MSPSETLNGTGSAFTAALICSLAAVFAVTALLALAANVGPFTTRAAVATVTAVVVFFTTVFAPVTTLAADVATAAFLPAIVWPFSTFTAVFAATAFCSLIL